MGENLAGVALSGKTLIRETVNLKKDKLHKTESLPEKLELALIDFGMSINLTAILNDKYFTIRDYYDLNEAREGYKKAEEKLRSGHYDIEFGLVINKINFH